MALIARLTIFSVILVFTSRSGANPILYKKAKSAAVLIITKANIDGKKLNFGGSGVIIRNSPGLILSAYHLVKSRVEDARIVCVPTASMAARIFEKNEDADPSLFKQHTCEIVAFDPTLDLVVLKRKEPGTGGGAAVEVATKNPEIGDPVYGVYAPNLVVGTWFTSYVNNFIDKPTNLEGLPSEFKLPMAIGFAAPTAAGASGSMVLNGKGQLVGMTFAGIFGTGTGLAVPASIIQTFIAKKLPKEYRN